MAQCDVVIDEKYLASDAHSALPPGTSGLGFGSCAAGLRRQLRNRVIARRGGILHAVDKR
jgi:hypothetical protein